MNSKKCDGCNTEHSLAWQMIKELNRKNKRLLVLLLTVSVLWLATIGSFVWHISQYENEKRNTLYSDGLNLYGENEKI